MLVRPRELWSTPNPELEHELDVYLWRRSLARALRRETCSLFGRIAELWRTRLYRRMVLIDPLYRTNAAPMQRSQAQDACNADMQKVFRRHTWMTQADARTFLLAWRLGLEWAVGNLDTSLVLMIPANSASFWWVNEEAARRERSLRKFLVTPQNSTTPPVSKRGQSTPPPLRE